MFESLKFWKRKDEFNFDSLGSESSNPAAPEAEQNPFSSQSTQTSFSPTSASANPFQTPHDNPFAMQSFQDKSQFEHAGSSIGQKDIELISSKLDTVKAMLENIIQRLDKIEREKSQDHSPPIEPKRWY